MYDYTLDRTYGELWCKIIILSWFTKLLYCMYSQPWEYIESLLKSIGSFNLTYRWYPIMVIYPYGLNHYWWRPMTTSILNGGIIISHEIKTVCPFRWSKGHVIMEYVVAIILLVEFTPIHLFRSPFRCSV